MGVNEFSATTEGSRPNLNGISYDDFKSFYWLKEELIAFCREHSLKTTGSKEELSKRIEHFLITGEKELPQSNKHPRAISRRNERVIQEPLSTQTIITENYRSDERHRAFFKSIIGPHFHFTTSFMNFFKENVGKTYQDAINEWYKQDERKKDPTYRSTIAPQFEYNRYIRAYCEHNPGHTIQDAINSWNEKKRKRGSTAYVPGSEDGQTE